MGQPGTKRRQKSGSSQWLCSPFVISVVDGKFSLGVYVAGGKFGRKQVAVPSRSGNVNEETKSEVSRYYYSSTCFCETKKLPNCRTVVFGQAVLAGPVGRAAGLRGQVCYFVCLGSGTRHLVTREMMVQVDEKDAYDGIRREKRKYDGILQLETDSVYHAICGGAIRGFVTRLELFLCLHFFFTGLSRWIRSGKWIAVQAVNSIPVFFFRVPESTRKWDAGCSRHSAVGLCW